MSGVKEQDLEEEEIWRGRLRTIGWQHKIIYGKTFR